MSDVKFLVMCPRPQNIETFEHLDQDDEVTAGEGLSSEYAATSRHSRSSIRRSTCRWFWTNSSARHGS